MGPERHEQHPTGAFDEALEASEVLRATKRINAREAIHQTLSTAERTVGRSRPDQTIRRQLGRRSEYPLLG